ncbi:hypothetical protein ACWKSP_04350 [Micromonosporaceae bacterium Da 78-11]
MILRLVTADGSRRPAVAESVEVADDGALTGWRSVSDGGVGWFAGRLPDTETAELRALAAAPPEPVLAPPESAQEVLEIGTADPVPIAGNTDGLAIAARALLDRLTDFPRAAVAVTFVAPDIARLTHRGTDPVRLDLGDLTVRATAWRGYYEPAGDWTGVLPGPAEVEARPGWTYDVPLGLDPAGEVTVHLAVDFVIRSGSTRVPVRARHTPAIPVGQALPSPGRTMPGLAEKGCG